MRILASIAMITILTALGAPLASSAPSGTSPLFRLLNPKTGDHLYTTSVSERDSAIANFGYQSEGICCYVFASQAPGTTPLFRLLNPKTGDHLYTTSAGERDSAIATFGYQSEGIACYVFDSPAPGTTPLLRLLNPQTGHHFYTTSKAELVNAVASLGYKEEGIACQVFGAVTPIASAGADEKQAEALKREKASKAQEHLGPVTPAQAIKARELLTYTAAIESVRRWGNPSTALAFTPRVFSPPGDDVLYETTDVSVSFEVTNLSTAPLNGHVTASMRYADDYTNPSSFAVQNLARGASVKGTVSAGRPPGTGAQTVHLYWRDAATPPLPQGGFNWTEADTITVNVVATPRYVKRAPYDLAYEDVDPNGFPLNARFGKQDEFFYRTGSRDLWQTPAPPDIWNDCLNAAERQTWVSADNDYNAFRNGYCKHSPGATAYLANYCNGDTPAPHEPGGSIYCASWSWKDDPFLLKCGTSPYLTPFHIEGHMNFTVATYEGVARWDNAQAEYNFDSDWCMDLYTFHGVGISNQQGERWIHTEHDPKNVGDDFDRGFWKEFRDKIKNGQQYCGDLQFCQGTKNNQARDVGPLINGKRAIVIGLLGLDMGHSGAGSELHPVYGMAIHTGARPRQQSGYVWYPNPRVVDDVYLHPELDPHFDTPQNANDDTWAIWAANYGSEGYCSTRALHVLDGNESIIGRKDFPTMGFRLPWTNYVSADGSVVLPMADVEVLDSTNFTLKAKGGGRNGAGYSVIIDRGKSVTVTFDMWPSTAEPNWFGELHLKWKRPAGSPAAFVAAPLNLTPARPAAESRAAKSNEEQNPTTGGMTEVQKNAFVAEMKKRGATLPLVVKESLLGTRRVVYGPAPPPPPPIQPRAHATLNALVRGGAEENAAAKRSICAAHGAKVPNAPADYCK